MTPISATNRARYPDNWKDISAAIRKRARNRCECRGECGAHANRCGARNGEPHPTTGSRVVLTVAHLNHQPEDCRHENLRAMCQRCHNRLDRPHRNRNCEHTRRAKKNVVEMFEEGA